MRTIINTKTDVAEEIKNNSNFGVIFLQKSLKEEMLDEIKVQGGFVNCHGHFDKSFYISRDGLDKSMVSMEEKWLMSDNLKKSLSQENIEVKIRKCLDLLIAQGSKNACTFVDAYDAVGHKAIDAAVKVKQEYRDRIDLKIATQPLGGLVNETERKLFEEICAKADIVGGLPSKDRPHDDENFDYLFQIARKLNKPIHIHIDQENNPLEKDSEKLIHYTKKYNYQGRVVAVHAISVSAQDKEYRKNIYKQFAELGIAVIVCPIAAVSMQQHDDKLAPVHNSIGNVPEMLEAGVLVGLGTDNISDFYEPFTDGDMWTEIRFLQEACRFYDFEKLVEIASVNGKKILEIL